MNKNFQDNEILIFSVNRLSMIRYLRMHVCTDCFNRFENKMKIQHWVSLEQDMNLGEPGRINIIKLECFNFTKINKNLF